MLRYIACVIWLTSTGSICAQGTLFHFLQYQHNGVGVIGAQSRPLLLCYDSLGGYSLFERIRISSFDRHQNSDSLTSTSLSYALGGFGEEYFGVSHYRKIDTNFTVEGGYRNIANKEYLLNSGNSRNLFYLASSYENKRLLGELFYSHEGINQRQNLGVDYDYVLGRREIGDNELGVDIRDESGFSKGTSNTLRTILNFSLGSNEFDLRNAHFVQFKGDYMFDAVWYRSNSFPFVNSELGDFDFSNNSGNVNVGLSSGYGLASLAYRRSSLFFHYGLGLKLNSTRWGSIIWNQKERTGLLFTSFEYTSDNFAASLEGEYAVVGWAKKNYNLYSSVEFNDLIDVFDLGFNARLLSQYANPFLDRFNSNGFIWDNNLLNLTSQVFGARVSFKDLSLDYTFNRSSGIVYIDPLKRINQTLNYTFVNSITLNFDKSIGHFKSDFDLTIQNVGGANVVRVPEILLFSDFSYLFDMFGDVVDANLGLRATYFSSYYPDEYFPLFNEWALQNEFVVGNEVFCDLYASFKIEDATITLEAVNLLSPSFQQTEFISYGYLARPLTYRVGFNWILFN